MILPKKCDLCGKTMDRWLHIKVGIGAGETVRNLSDLAPYCGECDICKDCFEALLRKRAVEVDE